MSKPWTEPCDLGCTSKGHDSDCSAHKGPAHNGPLETRLIARLQTAEQANQHGRRCQVCAALEKMSDQARVAVERALAGTIGERTLAQILTDAGYTTGRRAVANHRREGHTP